MRIFHRHIVTGGISLLLLMAVLSQIVMPVSALTQKARFAQWLDQSLVKAEAGQDTTVRNYIRQLPLQSESFAFLLEQAARLVMNHQQEFSIPFDETREDEKDVSQWLVGKWTQHKTDTGMNARMSDTHSFSLKWILHSTASPAIFESARVIWQVWNPQLPLSGWHTGIRYQKLPFLSGISINAP